MEKRKLINVILIILAAGAAVLNATPHAVLMRFADPERTLYKYVSGFSMLPVGYGLWGAMLAGVGSVLLVILGVAGLVKPSEKLESWMFGIAIAALLMRLTLLIFGSMTFIGGLICVILVAETVLLYYMRKSET